MKQSSALSAGEWVQVRTKEEILATLDERGQLDGLPFMPEMLAFCGRRFAVLKRAHKTCDPPNGLDGRRMLSAVHLDELRCNGDAHGGCQARCLFFWKDAWLERVDGPETAQAGATPPAAALLAMPNAASCTEQQLWAATRRAEPNACAGQPAYACQSTQIPQATEPLRAWDFSQYIEDYTSGNVRLGEMFASLWALLCQHVVNAGLGLGTFAQAVYNGLQRVTGGAPYPWRVGLVPPGRKTPSGTLDLQPGEWVRVKSYEDILSTVNEQGNNRGMSFDAEMVPFCGGTYRVLDRVSRIINEKTGAMHTLKNDCIILDSVVCRACYAEHRRFCPRGIFPYWREIWLERVPARDGQVVTEPGRSASAALGSPLPLIAPRSSTH